MVATLEAEGTGGFGQGHRPAGVPRVGTGQTDVKPDSLRIVLVPTNAEDVARLVPGLRFTGTVDTGTGPPDRQRLVYIGD